jgi:YHS domain-containing protein
MSTLLWIVGIGVVFYLMRKSGGGCCGGHDHGNDEGHSDHGTPSNRADSNEKSHPRELYFSRDETQEDPVCGMKTGNHSIVRNHLGRTFHFCSEQCGKVFDLNPNKYVKTT